MSDATKARAVAVLALTVFLAGCGDDGLDAEGDPETPITLAPRPESIACSLLTPDDLEAEGLAVALGPDADADSVEDDCVFELEADDAAVVADRLVVAVYPEADAELLAADVYPDAESLDGVGAEAWLSAQTRVAQVRFDDGRVLSVQWVSTSTNDPTDVLTALAAAASENA